VAWGASRALLSPDAAVPVVSTVLLLLAAVCGVIAWRHGRMNPRNVTYTDVAGALTLIGLCAAATIDPDQMIRLTMAERE
jgi:tryptophan-rich sensory protein